MKNWIKKHLKKIKANKKSVAIFIIILCLFIFLRFYQIEEKSQFSIDQVNDAWVAKNFIVDGKIPVLGTQSRLNSGIFMGPFYHYYLSGFYFITNLDPIAAGISSGVAGIITLVTIFIVSKKLFSTKFALIAIIIYSVSYSAIIADRIQWTVNFLVPVSILIFYALYKIITGSEKHLLLLGIMLGLSFHVHFTSVFYLPIILLALPFFPFRGRAPLGRSPRTQEFIKYLVYGILAFLIVMLPTIVHMVLNKGGGNLFSYLGVFYHGLHLRRVMQLFSDAFIQFEQILFFPQLKPLEFFFLPLFVIVFFKERVNRDRLLFVYLAALWFLIPWFVLSLYSGEITDYYFLINRPIVLMILSFFIYKLVTNPSPVMKIIAVLIIVFYAQANLNKFVNFEQKGLAYNREETLRKIKYVGKIQFSEGSTESYLYYIYKERHEPLTSPWKWK